MSEYNIIPISKVKVEQLNEFYKKTYPKRYKTLTNNWQWWYRSKHSKLRPLTLLIKDKIVGQLGLLPVDLNNDEKMISAIWLTDFAILPEYQGKGFGQILTKELMKTCSTQITFCNDLSLKVFKKCGWETNFSTKRLIKPINILKFLPITRKLNFKYFEKTLKYFTRVSLKNKNIVKIHPAASNFEVLKDSFKVRKDLYNKQILNVVRNEDWLHWRLIECPYKNNIYFFEYKNNFSIVHIFFDGKIKKLNILYTYYTDTSFEEDLLNLIINWAVDNNIDLVWTVSKNTKNKNIFPNLLSKPLNFGYWSSEASISKLLKNGLSDPQGIDSDVDSSLHME